jgi:hypothetical protein
MDVARSVLREDQESARAAGAPRRRWRAVCRWQQRRARDHQVHPRQEEPIAVSCACSVDEAYRRHPFDRFWVSSLWDRAERLIPLLLSRLELARRPTVVTAMFSEGAAIGWLTSLFRHETGAHGLGQYDRLLAAAA